MAGSPDDPRELPALDGDAAWAQLTEAMRLFSHQYERAKLTERIAVETAHAASRVGYSRIANRTAFNGSKIHAEFLSVYEELTSEVVT